MLMAASTLRNIARSLCSASTLARASAGRHLAFRFRLQAFPLQFTPGMNRNLPWSFWGVLIQALIFDNAKFEVDVYEMQSPSSLHYAGYAVSPLTDFWTSSESTPQALLFICSLGLSAGSCLDLKS